MTYTLIIGDIAHSSWSLRGWLLFEKFGLPHKLRHAEVYGDVSLPEQMALPPARTVPAMQTPEGSPVWDSLAMAEELASRHPKAGIWPTNPEHRAVARSLAAEMHSGFTALRSQCPMGVVTAYDWSDPSAGVRADLARIETIWQYARTVCQPEGPWLCGAYSAADVFYAPVAARIAGFALPVGDAARAYVAAHLADPAFRRWRAMAVAQARPLAQYAQPHPRVPWPGPATRAAAATEKTNSINAACPYSGRPVTDFLEMDGRVYGFCNPFCRDKTVADPEAWPAFAKLAGIPAD